MTIGRTLASGSEIPGRSQPKELEEKTGFHRNGHTGQISRSGVACELLNKLPYGIVCVDVKLRIESMNDAARALLFQDDGLSICDNRLVAATPRQTGQIQALVTQAMQGRLAPQSSGVWIVRIPRRRSVGRSFEVVASRLSSREDPAQSEASVLFIFDPDGEIEPDANLVASLYGLTAAEVCVAIKLMQGKTLEETAAILDRTKETVRKQLQSIFDKTNTNRQSELIRLLLRGPAAMHF